jgi:hypothetical protein
MKKRGASIAPMCVLFYSNGGGHCHMREEEKGWEPGHCHDKLQCLLGCLDLHEELNALQPSTLLHRDNHLVDYRLVYVICTINVYFID